MTEPMRHAIRERSRPTDDECNAATSAGDRLDILAALILDAFRKSENGAAALGRLGGQLLVWIGNDQRAPDSEVVTNLRVLGLEADLNEAGCETVILRQTLKLVLQWRLAHPCTPQRCVPEWVELAEKLIE